MPRGNPSFRRVVPVEKGVKTIHEQTLPEYKAENPEAKPIPPVQNDMTEFVAPVARTWDEIESVQSEDDALELVSLCQIPSEETTVFVSEDKKVMFYSHFGWLREHCTKNHLKLYEVTCH